ncbi:hypothetical protein PFISCL1PPCAC_6328 [Pristionchus fissidentatus]|uniref:Protein Wnt n=1 Tax=Pristionchus fissidentatus TaxID=1538716 RepID=A0AAV5V600_9BILA|nr:hypothetical protein PFISCL1PPCAC_6328 [Pristionchus fissidentatus]
MRFPLLLLTSSLLIQSSMGLGMSWLSGGLVAWSDGGGNRTACKDLKGVSKRQLRFCRRNPDVVPSIAIGAFNAYSECQYQFKKRRWNCTLLETSEGGGKGLETGTREAAFVHAISSAGIAYRVTKDCSKGLSDKCGCDHTGNQRITSHSSTKEQFEFEGCSDNIHYGIGVSREFVDASERVKNKSEESRVNLHNNRAGREVIEKSLRRECKCHGMSGSCEVKTCWMSMPPFREVGETMREKFDGASEVIISTKGDETRMTMKHNHLKRHTHADLVYMRQSPDYCNIDESRGILGTRGRECNHTSAAMDGCQLMCCNRGFKKVVKRSQEKCNCKFIYCCKVECQTCFTEETSYVCL